MDLHTPLKLNHQLTLKNRVVVPPMASSKADQHGFVTPDTLQHYSHLAKSNASLLMVEYTYVHKSGKSEPNQLGIDSDDHIAGLTKLADSIRSTGALSAIQLTHSGAKTTRSQTGGPLISPSGVRVPVKGQQLELPDKAGSHEIDLIKQEFFAAAKRATKAGFQIIELHAAHGYGINQWLSPLTNQRNDTYGGSNRNRARLLLETIELIRTDIPNAVLSVRIPGLDHFPDGLTHEDSIQIAKMLESAGVSIINVSSGIGGWRRPRARFGEGYLVDDAQIIAQQVNVPVIGVGGIKTAKYINESLLQKRFALAAVGRSILNHPEWGAEIGLS